MVLCKICLHDRRMQVKIIFIIYWWGWMLAGKVTTVILTEYVLILCNRTNIWKTPNSRINRFLIHFLKHFRDNSLIIDIRKCLYLEFNLNCYIFLQILKVWKKKIKTEFDLWPHFMQNCYHISFWRHRYSKSTHFSESNDIWYTHIVCLTIKF